jgi:5'-nucleotidase / UDP-sugar diphosphatase
MHSALLGFFGVASLAFACEGPRVVLTAGSGSTSTVPSGASSSSGKTELVLIHTADLHSHLFPEPTLIGKADAARGLGVYAEVDAVGGFARVATLVHRERQAAVHALFLDSGDLIEGTAAYTAFGGEPEMRAMSALQPDAVALGNHDLDPAVSEFVDKHARFAHFSLLAANYTAPGTAFGRTFTASIKLNANGLRVGVIGVANPTSPGGLDSPDNTYGIVLAPTADAVQIAIDALRPSVDLIVAITHLGLDADEAMISATSGLDVVLGGHQHLTIDEPIDRTDCGPKLQAERGCAPRRVILVHSGALGRYVGRVRLTLAAGASGAGAEDGLEVVSAEHTLLPVSASVPDDPALAALLEPYRARLTAAGFDTPLAFALGPVQRYGVTGGDSPLGNLIADAVRARAGTNFAILNTTGIRADLPPGVLTKSAFTSALPFADTLSVLSITGAQLRTLLDKQAQVAMSRGCESPLQVSGFTWGIRCPASGAAISTLAAATSTPQPVAAPLALDPTAVYSLVTTDYLADGGSGFEALTEVSARRELELDPLDVLLDAVAALPPCAQSELPCLDPGVLRDGRVAITAD